MADRVMPQLPSSPLDPALDASLRDSLQRSQLNPLQIAEALQTLRQAAWSYDQIKTAYSFSPEQTSQYLRLQKLPPAIQDQIRRKELTFSQARELSRLLEGHTASIEEAAGRIVRDKMSQRESGDYITSLIKVNDAKKPPKKGETSASSPAADRGQPAPSPSAAPAKNPSPATPPEGQPARKKEVRDTDAGFDSLAETIGKSYLWDVASSIPVVWRMLPWLRSQTHEMKGSVEKRRVFVGWVMILAALWFFWPRIWSAIKHLRTPRAPESSSSGSGALQAPVPGPSQEVPIPQMAKPVFGAGHRIELHWQDLGPAYRYHVYYLCGTIYDAAQMTLLSESVPIHTPGALVDIPATFCRDGGYLAVMAENADHHMSDLSAEESFDGLNAANQAYLAEPLTEVPENLQNGAAANPNGGQPDNRLTRGSASGSLSKKENQSPPSRLADVQVGRSSGQPPSSRLSASDISELAKAGIGSNYGLMGRLAGAAADLVGKAGSSNPSPAPRNSGAQAPSFPGPAQLQWAPIPGSRAIHLSWQDMGAGYHYNVYASLAGDTLQFDRDGVLLRQASGDWTPPKKGVQVFVFYVTAIDPQGHESAPSPQKLVDLR